ncbi:hypothetical protein OG943_09625 [Amycolatopsis sp. NBC_00345]
MERVPAGEESRLALVLRRIVVAASRTVRRGPGWPGCWSGRT